jgi:hypothetical protein
MMNSDMPANVATGPRAGAPSRFFCPRVSVRALVVRAVSVSQVQNGCDHRGQTLNNSFYTGV